MIFHLVSDLFFFLNWLFLFGGEYNKVLFCFSAPIQAVEVQDPCNPSPCGPNSQCRASGSSPSCSCLTGYIGSPPNCRPECVINPDCPAQQSCINNKCRDPCPGSCGVDAECRVISHAVSCVCPVGYSGNPFVQCVPQKRKYYFF